MFQRFYHVRKCTYSPNGNLFCHVHLWSWTNIYTDFLDLYSYKEHASAKRCYNMSLREQDRQLSKIQTSKESAFHQWLISQNIYQAVWKAARSTSHSFKKKQYLHTNISTFIIMQLWSRCLIKCVNLRSHWEDTITLNMTLYCNEHRVRNALFFHLKEIFAISVHIVCFGFLLCSWMWKSIKFWLYSKC